MNRLTIFTWGYWGWGNATPEFVRLVDDVEAARGFAAPIFVDVRISRAVRAEGFIGNAFGKLVGDERYRHMRGLGNLSVLGQAGPAVQIKEPSQVSDLLRLAQELAIARRRLLFFCSCEFPRLEGEACACHRVTVARLLLEAARSQHVPLEIEEWPGGAPQVLDLDLAPDMAKKLLHGRRSVPLGPDFPQDSFASLTWGSIIRIRSRVGEFGVVVSPLRCERKSWQFPVPWDTADKDTPFAELEAKARRWRQEFGFDARSTS